MMQKWIGMQNWILPRGGRLLLAGLLWLCVGCAGQPLTPVQERTWGAVKECESTYPTVQVGRVDQDGRWWRRELDPSGKSGMFDQCVRERRAVLSRASVAAASPKDLIVHAHFIIAAPPAGVLTSTPEAITTFKVDNPVTFFLGMNQSSRVFQAKFKWYAPNGVLVLRQDRVIRDPKDSTQLRVWQTQVLPSAQVQQTGRWGIELYLDDQRIDRYEFTVSR